MAFLPPPPGVILSVTFGAPLPEASVRASLGMGPSVRGSWRDDDGDGEGKHQGGYFKERRWQM